MSDSPYVATPGKKFKLTHFSTNDTGQFKDKAEAADSTHKNLIKLSELQQVLYAGAERGMLVVLQAMDTGGKDGAIEHVFGGVNPQGCSVTSFKTPTSLEKAHDFLWRIHAAAPPKGMIGIFNRSHYESVLVERIHKLAPAKVWEKRYDHINAFEKLLVDEGVAVVKFFLHISKEEQKRRLEARLADEEKHWKFNVGDLKERELWDDYQGAYEDAIQKCSTSHAPWHIVPADRKWFRNWVISDTLVKTLKSMDLKYPPAPAGLDKIEVR